MKRLTSRDKSGFYHLRRGPKGGEINKVTVVQHLGRLEDAVLQSGIQKFPERGGPSMTREEAIAELESIKQCQVDTRKEIEALDLAIYALRPVSREQVERMRGEWRVTVEVNKSKEFRSGPPNCSRCGAKSPGRWNFCGQCGAPMTDEAVDMVMDRLEALQGA